MFAAYREDRLRRRNVVPGSVIEFARCSEPLGQGDLGVSQSVAVAHTDLLSQIPSTQRELKATGRAFVASHFAQIEEVGMRRWSVSGIVRAVVCLIVLSGCSSAIHADELYVYVGNSFNRFHGSDSCPPECRFSGFFITAQPIAANLPGSDLQGQFDVTPLFYEFTDGNVVATSFNSSFDFFSVTTDGSGNITNWAMRFFTPASASNGTVSGFTLLTERSISPTVGTEDISIQDPAAVNFAASLDNPGKWIAIPLHEGPVPEPSTLLLLGSGVLGLVPFRRRFAH